MFETTWTQCQIPEDLYLRHCEDFVVTGKCYVLRDANITFILQVRSKFFMSLTYHHTPIHLQRYMNNKTRLFQNTDNYDISNLTILSQWSRGLRHRSAAAHLVRSWVRIPPGAWMFVVSVMCCQVEVSVTS
jgi:hypothetical protein